MSKFDLIFMSLRSLWRRKLRSSLTILGVVIGTASIVLMISLALAMNQNYENQMNEWGSLTLIEVTEEDTMDDLVEVEALDDDAVALFETIPNVTYVMPYISTTMNVTVGDYGSMREITIIGYDADELQALSYIPVTGEAYAEGDTNVAIAGGTFTNQLVKRGQQVGSKTSSSKSSSNHGGMPGGSGGSGGSKSGGGNPPSGGNMPSGGMPGGDMGGMPPGDSPNDQSSQKTQGDSVDLFNNIVKLTYQTFSFKTMTNNKSASNTSSNANASSSSNNSSSSTISTPKATHIEILGVLESGNTETDNYLLMPREDVLNLIRQKAIYTAKVNNTTPETTVDTYDKVTLKVNSSENVATVKQLVERYGFKTSTAQDTLSEMENMSASIQMILMGIGAISLIVSAIGITNTMMMSISERTKEIGVMKVIGAVISDIKQMFLVEAAIIGFIGGSVGVVLCLIISWLLNHYALGFFGDLVGASSDYETYVSIIPLYLASASILFSTIIGVLAGYMPAKRATQLSALTALKSD